MKRDFAGFLLLLSVSTSAIGQTANGEVKNQGNSIDEIGIKKVLADQVEAWNRHDAKAFSMAFAEDADFTNVVGASTGVPKSKSFTRRCSRPFSKTRT